jgi:hypothetical protein
MKNISAALQAFLLGNTVFNRADLIQITLPNGVNLNVLFGTNIDITYQGVTYYCSKYGAWERGAFTNEATFRMSAGVWDLRALIKESVNYPGTTTPLMQVINVGMLNGAKVSVQTLFWPLGQMPSAGFSMGTMKLTEGQIGDVSPAGRSMIKCDVYDLTYLLNRPSPPFQVQTGCRHNLFDHSCTLLLSNFQSTNVTLGSGSTTLYMNLVVPSRANSTHYNKGDVIDVGNIIFMCTSAGTTASSSPSFNPDRGQITVDGSAQWTSQDNAYSLGYVVFTGGQNSGLQRAIKTQYVTAGVQILQLFYPMQFPVNAGDTITLVPGCDKSLATCVILQGSQSLAQIHFGGTPFVPNPENAS